MAPRRSSPPIGADSPHKNSNSPLDRYPPGPPPMPGYDPQTLKKWTVQAAREAARHGPLWFYNAVDTANGYDPKNKSAALENFGNYNYGYMVRHANYGLGFPLGVLLRQAGRKHRSDERNAREPGSPGLLAVIGGQSPYGDDMRDQEMIRLGYWDAVRDEQMRLQRPRMLNER